MIFFSLIYRFIELVLVLSAATTSVKQVFLVMNVVKIDSQQNGRQNR